MRRILCTLLTLCCLSVAFAQMPQPVKMTASIKEISATEAIITFNATIDAGWHMYSTEVVPDGPNPTTITIDNISGAKLNGPLKAQGNVIKHYDDMFGAEVYYFENKGQFVQKVTLTGGKYHIEGYLQHSACNDQNCTPPTNLDFKFDGEAPQKGTENTEKKEDTEKVAENAEETEKADSTQNSENTEPSEFSEFKTSDASADGLWAPVIDQLKAFEDGGNANATNSPLWYIFILGFIGGLIALVTPCVWPIIPMTVSFFLKKGTTKKSTPEEIAAAKKRGIRDAIIYGLSIVVIYVALGLIVTGLFGASALNSLATNAVFNIFFFLMLLVFGASFLGAFELTLPSKWTNAVDSKAGNTSGLLAIFLMAFTLTLVSFSCTGPIIGFLLVEVATDGGSILAPTIGMLGFAIALALPFTFFAMFPSMLKSAPKSGNWMNVVKVTLGFIEIAFSLKFFSVADLAYGWGLLDRETFLALWIVLFALLGSYLIGWIRFPHDEDEYDEMGNVVVNPKTSVTRFFLALISFAFAVYMIPGLWGAPCKAVSAFAPPMSTQDFNIAPEAEVRPMFTDYEEGMKYAAEHNMPVMIDFTGYGCVNCRKMEAAVFTDPTVAELMTKKYVLIQLFVDEKKSLPEAVEVTVADQTRKLRTVGDKWSYLQANKFGANAQPFYVLLDNQGNPLTKSYSYNEDIPAYISWLNEGLKAYNK